MTSTTSLLSSYDDRFVEAIELGALTQDNLQSSLAYFEAESIRANSPKPKTLEVICLVCGLPLPTVVRQYAMRLQENMNKMLSGKCAYFVREHNLATELVVLKWPTDLVDDRVTAQVAKYMRERGKLSEIKVETRGIQFHSDGAIVMRCVDVEGEFRSLREKLLNEVALLPRKQSEWVHVPLGRILSPIAGDQFKLLVRYCSDTQLESPIEFRIETAKLIHETRWYQEERVEIDSFEI